ncbi:MAG: translation elongation factor Ts [Bacilli bacterium]
MISAQLVKELREITGAGMMDCKKALVETNGNIEDAITWLREKGISKAAKKSDRVAAEGLCSIALEKNKAVVFEVNSETDFVAKNENFIKVVDEIGQAILNSDATNTEEALKVLSNGKTVEEVVVAATAKIGEKISLRRVNVITKTDSQVFGAYSHMGGKIVSLTLLDGANDEVAKDVAMHIAAMKPVYLDMTQIPAEEVEKEREIAKQQSLNEGKPLNIVEKMVEGRVNKYFKEICLVYQPFVKNPDQTVEQYVKANNGKVVKFLRLEVGEGIDKKACDFVAEVMAAVNN